MKYLVTTIADRHGYYYNIIGVEYINGCAYLLVKNYDEVKSLIKCIDIHFCYINQFNMSGEANCKYWIHEAMEFDDYDNRAEYKSVDYLTMNRDKVQTCASYYNGEMIVTVRTCTGN